MYSSYVCVVLVCLTSNRSENIYLYNSSWFVIYLFKFNCTVDITQTIKVIFTTFATDFNINFYHSQLFPLSQFNSTLIDFVSSFLCFNQPLSQASCVKPYQFGQFLFLLYFLQSLCTSHVFNQYIYVLYISKLRPVPQIIQLLVDFMLVQSQYA